VDDVADRLDLDLEENLLLGRQGEEVLLLLLEIGYARKIPLSATPSFLLCDGASLYRLLPHTFLLQEIGDILLCLLLGTDLLLDGVDLGVELGGRVCSCFFIIIAGCGQHCVHLGAGAW